MERSNVPKVQNISDVMSFFGLDVPKSTVPISEGLNKNNYAVSTISGDYVIRFLTNQSSEDIENDVAIQNQLKEAGVPSPIYSQNKNGDYLFSRDDINAVISKKITGVIPRKTDRKLATDIGQKLALFHKAVARLPHQNNKGLMNSAVSGIHSSLFQQQLPKGIIHGDFHLGNMLVDAVDKNKVVAVLDFEEAGENIFIIDLAVTVMASCSPTGAEGNTVDLELIRAAINGYEAVRPLAKEEKDSFPEAVRYSAEAWIKWFKDNNYPEYAEKHQQRLNSYQAQSKN